MDAHAKTDFIDAGPESEAWLAVALRRRAQLGALDLDLPIGMHLPLLASVGANFITARHVLEHTSHLGAGAYEAYLASNPGVDSLTAQSFLVSLGSDDTPGERAVWRPANLDLMAWLVRALGGGRPLEAVLSEWLGAEVRLSEPAAGTPGLRAARLLSVPRAAHASVVDEWKRTSVTDH